jgi:hypothetical protein
LRLFRRLFLQYLQEAHDTERLQFTGSLAALVDARAFAAHLAPARQTEWVVYAKRPLGQPDWDEIRESTPEGELSR